MGRGARTGRVMGTGVGRAGEGERVSGNSWLELVWEDMFGCEKMGSLHNL